MNCQKLVLYLECWLAERVWNREQGNEMGWNRVAKNKKIMKIISKCMFFLKCSFLFEMRLKVNFYFKKNRPYGHLFFHKPPNKWWVCKRKFQLSSWALNYRKVNYLNPLQPVIQCGIKLQQTVILSENKVFIFHQLLAIPNASTVGE